MIETKNVYGTGQFVPMTQRRGDVWVRKRDRKLDCGTLHPHVKTCPLHLTKHGRGEIQGRGKKNGNGERYG